MASLTLQSRQTATTFYLVEHALSEGWFCRTFGRKLYQLLTFHSVLRLHMKKDGDDDAEIYTTKDAAMLRGKGFITQAGFLLIAVLHGADYKTVS